MKTCTRPRQHGRSEKCAWQKDKCKKFTHFAGILSFGINDEKVAFSVITAIALTSLFETTNQLEDPFVENRLDGIDVEAELRDEFLGELLEIRRNHFPDAPPFDATVLFPVTKRGPEIRLFQAG
jgi:hypothetical protein